MTVWIVIICILKSLNNQNRHFYVSNPWDIIAGRRIIFIMTAGVEKW